MKDYMNLDTQSRNRTYADRKAFVLAETAAETAAALAAAAAPKAAAPISTEAVIDPNWQRQRERHLARESAEAAREGAFLRVLGELTYRALPLDEAEKAPYHETILEQTAELARAVAAHWSLTEAGLELLETAAGAVAEAEDWTAAVAASLSGGELEPMVEHIAGEIERRVVEAIVVDRARAERVEGRLAEVTAVSSGDAELDAYRARRTLKRAAPSLMEALYVANRRVLAEDAGREVAETVVMVEAVCQYTLIETLAAVGVMVVETTDIDALARRLTARKA